MSRVSNFSVDDSLSSSIFYELHFVNREQLKWLPFTVESHENNLLPDLPDSYKGYGTSTYFGYGTYSTSFMINAGMVSS